MERKKIMNLKNIVLLSLVAVASSSNAKFSFKAGAFGGLAIQRAKTEAFTGAAAAGFTTGVKADKSKKGFFAAAFIDATMDKKCLDFGVAVNLFYSNAKPKKVNIGAAAPFVGFQLKNRGIMLAVGPKIGLNKGKFALGAGVSLTLAGYKLIVTDITAAPAVTTTTEFKSKMFRTLGAMPWVRAGYKLGDAEVFALVGHNFSKKPNLKKTSTTAPAAAGAVAGLAMYNAAVNGVKPIKTSGTYFGVGAAIKVA